MQNPCTHISQLSPPLQQSPPAYESMRTYDSTTISQVHSLKPVKLSSDTISSNLVIHIGNKSWAQEWVSYQLHHEKLYSILSMNNTSSSNGPNMSSTIIASLMTALASGFHTPALHKLKSYGKTSNSACKTGMDLNENHSTIPHL